MSILGIIGLTLQFLIELWRSSKKTPEEIKLEAVAKITKDMNSDLNNFEKALASNDAQALSAHFEELRLRVLKSTGGK